MRCCVSFCKNSSDAISRSQKVTFHEFPTDQFWRDAWLMALGMEKSHLMDHAKVCSLHFKNMDFYVTKSGARILQKRAVPSAVQVCLICLNTDTKLYPMSKYHLEEAYTNVTGLTISDEINFMRLLCAQCSRKLMNSNQFRDNCLRAHHMLLELVTKHELLTTQHIKTINREKYMSSNLVTKSFETNHCDLHMVEHKEEEKTVKPETNMYNTVKKVEVKHESKDGLALVIEPMAVDLKCDNESDEEFLHDDIDNDIDFLNNEIIEVEILKNDTDDHVHSIKNSVSKYHNVKNKPAKDISVKEVSNNSDVEILSEVKTVRKVNKSVKSVVRKKHAKVKPKVKKTISKVRKRRGKCNDKKKLATKVDLKLFTETILTFEEQLAEVMQRKETSNYKTSNYKCSLCFKGFINILSYNRHMVKHTNQCGEMECALCRLHFKDRNQMNHHLKSFHTMRYSCTSCLYVTKQRFTASLHERWHKGTKYKCPKCDDEFSRLSTYMSHLRVKHPSDFVCTLCGFSFVSQKGIQQHTRLKHRFDDVQNPEGPLCAPCNVRFASDTAYNQHMKVSPKHTTDGARVRNDPSGYSSWRRMPDDEYVTCEECGIQLKDFRLYMSHFKRVHPDKIRTKYPRTKRRCLCEQCGKILESPTLLRYHMAVHTGLKQFQCDVCQKRFAVQTQLTLHKKIHSDERPTFGCTICGKSFSSQSNRDRHIWIHNDKYFKCEICEKSFGTAAERRSHIAHVHLKKPWPKRKRGPRTQGGRGGQGKEIKMTEDGWRPDYDTSVVPDTNVLADYVQDPV